MQLASDNTAGVCDEVLAALGAEAARVDAAYGDDAASADLVRVLSEVFEHEVAVFPVATGTAANSLALAATCPPWGGVLCHPDAHIAVDELAAPTLVGGGLTLHHVDGDHGRIDVDALRERFVRVDHGVHTVPFRALSLTQPTEAGTRYHVSHLAELSDVAHSHGLVVHVDGARFANAVASTGASPAELTWRAGVDVLSLGATKGGALAAEAVVLFDPDLAPHLDRHRKRTGHLLSKQRLVSAQLLGWLADGAWLRHADHANSLAERLASGLSDLGLVPVHPVEANMVFVEVDAATAVLWADRGARFYTRPLGRGRVEARLVTSWASSVEDVDAFVALAARARPAQ